ncbi:protein of unknown function [Xenorhabdus nematophila AN6/1]|nr:protein of unknown function [Xenorhabdus nematophila AN6/1]
MFNKQISEVMGIYLNDLVYIAGVSFICLAEECSVHHILSL